MEESLRDQMMRAISSAQAVGGMPILCCAAENLDELIDTCEENIHEFQSRGLFPIVRVESPPGSSKKSLEPEVFAVLSSLLSIELAQKIGIHPALVLLRFQEKASQFCEKADPAELQTILENLSLKEDRTSDRN